MDRRTLLATLASGAAVAASPFARAQEYPAQLVKWVVPYPAGGGTDVIARVLAESMRQTLGQQIVVDNRPGASTNIGADIVAKSKPDGYTILSADNAVLAFNEYLFSKLPFNPEKDFTYIGAIGKFPLALVVHPDFPAKNFKDFLAYVKANPGKVNYASPGNGSPHHLAMEMFKVRTGTFITHIPYRGAAARLVADLLEQQQREPREEQRFALGARLADGARALGIEAVAGVGLERCRRGRHAEISRAARANAGCRAPGGRRCQRAATWPSGRSR